MSPESARQGKETMNACPIMRGPAPRRAAAVATSDRDFPQDARFDALS
jgi:hypothetical protein